MTYSYHIFMFPFQWNIPAFKDNSFTKQIDFNSIHFSNSSNWERTWNTDNKIDQENVYNEKNYFYEFVHDALYDKGGNCDLIRHYERTETKHGDVRYKIECKNKSYTLKTEAINLNLYSTGVGVLSFHLRNDSYDNQDDILKINQFGRRLYLPFFRGQGASE